MKTADINRGGPVWSFAPTVHKGLWRGKGRTIFFGPEARTILEPLIAKAGDGYIFSPAAGELERIAKNSANRKTPRYPSHMARNARKRVGLNRKRPPGEQYSTEVIRRAIERACVAAKVDTFTPHRIRHLAALTIREKFGIEHARAMLAVQRTLFTSR